MSAILTLLCTRPPSSLIRWQELPPEKCVLVETTAEAVMRSLRVALLDYNIRVGRVIFDRGFSSESFQRFIAELPQAFDGDVLLIQPDGTGLLSTMKCERRVLHFRTPGGVGSYLEDLPINATAAAPIEKRPRSLFRILFSLSP